MLLQALAYICDRAPVFVGFVTLCLQMRLVCIVTLQPCDPAIVFVL
jgi:hypothetical protein